MKPWLAVAWFAILTVIVAHGAIEAIRFSDDWGGALFVSFALFGANQTHGAYLLASEFRPVKAKP